MFITIGSRVKTIVDRVDLPINTIGTIEIFESEDKVLLRYGYKDSHPLTITIPSSIVDQVTKEELHHVDIQNLLDKAYHVGNYYISKPEYTINKSKIIKIKNVTLETNSKDDIYEVELCSDDFKPLGICEAYKRSSLDTCFIYCNPRLEKSLSNKQIFDVEVDLKVGMRVYHKILNKPAIVVEVDNYYVKLKLLPDKMELVEDVLDNIRLCKEEDLVGDRWDYVDVKFKKGSNYISFINGHDLTFNQFFTMEDITCIADHVDDDIFLMRDEIEDKIIEMKMIDIISNLMEVEEEILDDPL